MNASLPLGQLAAGGAILTGGSQAIRALLSIATTIVVARILTPDDYGVMAMAAPVFALVLLVQDLGFSSATIQTDEITQEQSSTLFWFNVAASALIGVVLILVSPWIGAFYDDHRVGQVTAALCATILVTSFGLQHTALLNRRMRFREIAIITVASAIVNCVTSIVLAFALRTFWALFFGGLAGILVQVVMSWIASKWRPSPSFSVCNTRSLLRFGGYVATFDVLNFLSRNADNVLIGRFWGAAPLGLYDRSQRLMLAPLQLVNAPLAKVMLPVLSRLRTDPQRYRSSYLFCLRVLMLMTVPGVAVAIATSDVLVPLLLGDQWRDASPIFFWLAFAALYQPLANSTGWVFLSLGRGRDYALWGAISSFITLVSFIVGLPWGAVGVARAYVIFGLLRLPFLIAWVSKEGPVRASDLYGVALAYLLLAAFLWSVVGLLSRSYPSGMLILVSLPLAYAVTLLLLWGTPGGRTFLQSLYRLARSASLA